MVGEGGTGSGEEVMDSQKACAEGLGKERALALGDIVGVVAGEMDGTLVALEAWRVAFVVIAGPCWTHRSTCSPTSERQAEKPQPGHLMSL